MSHIGRGEQQRQHKKTEAGLRRSPGWDTVTPTVFLTTFRSTPEQRYTSALRMVRLSVSHGWDEQNKTLVPRGTGSLTSLLTYLKDALTFKGDAGACLQTALLRLSSSAVCRDKHLWGDSLLQPKGRAKLTSD